MVLFSTLQLQQLLQRSLPLQDTQTLLQRFLLQLTGCLLTSQEARRSTSSHGDLFRTALKRLWQILQQWQSVYGVLLSGKGIDCLIAIGPECRHMAKGAETAGVANVFSCEDKSAALNVLADWVKPDTTFLVKASRGMRLEEISAYLLEQTKEG